MFRKLTPLVVFAGGVAAGVAFVLSCSDSNTSLGPPSATAQPSCSQYETMTIDTNSTAEQLNLIPAGWVPFAVLASNNNIVALRCAQ
jgi:hypothetical protein